VPLFQVNSPFEKKKRLFSATHGALSSVRYAVCRSRCGSSCSRKWRGRRTSTAASKPS
jgi:hypothetical protein